MMKVGQLVQRGVVLFATRQMNLKYLVPIQIRPQRQHVLEATATALQPIYLPSNSIIKLHKSTDAKKTHSVKRTRQLYSKDDDKFIIEQVKWHGYTIETFKKIAKALGRKYPYAVKLHYDEYIAKQHDVTGSFSSQEDQKIIEHVSIHGKDKESFEDIAKNLGRPIYSVRERCSRLLSENEYETNSDMRQWDLAEDKILINCAFKLKDIDSSNIFTLWEVNKSEFREIAVELKRSSLAVYGHWQKLILPLLEPHLEKLTSSKCLKKDVLEIVGSRFEKTTQLRGYSDEDIKFIVEQVQLKGDVSETWVFIAKKLGKRNPEHVKYFYHNYILQTPRVKGPFTPEEDEIILRYVKEHGTIRKSFRDLAKELGRGSASSVQSRYNKIV